MRMVVSGTQTIKILHKSRMIIQMTTNASIHQAELREYFFDFSISNSMATTMRNKSNKSKVILFLCLSFFPNKIELPIEIRVEVGMESGRGDDLKHFAAIILPSFCAKCKTVCCQITNSIHATPSKRRIFLFYFRYNGNAIRIYVAVAHWTIKSMVMQLIDSERSRRESLWFCESCSFINACCLFLLVGLEFFVFVFVFLSFFRLFLPLNFTFHIYLHVMPP